MPAYGTDQFTLSQNFTFFMRTHHSLLYTTLYIDIAVNILVVGTVILFNPPVLPLPQLVLCAVDGISVVSIFLARESTLSGWSRHYMLTSYRTHRS